mmetsp:Transcript_13531/g.34537  ORF Transcript_13531/g.34537 Transcript_13531/m.34537 type:complete len:485 (-) Transcript_13531:16-1470(-)
MQGHASFLCQRKRWVGGGGGGKAPTNVRLTAHLHGDGAEHGVVAANARAVFVVRRLGVANVVELGRGGKHASAKPHSVALHVVSDDVHGEGHRLDLAAAQLLALLDAVVDSALHVALQALAKVLEHGGAARQDDVLVETTASVDGAALDSVVHNLRKRGEEVTAVDLGVEEHLRAKEALVADVTDELLLGHRLDDFVLLDPLAGLVVVLLVLLDDVRADVAVLLLHTLGDIERLRGGNVGAFTLTHQLLHKAGNITASDGDVLDGATDDVTLSHRNDVCNTVPGVDDSSSQGALRDLLGSPRGCKGKDCLHSDVKAGDIESLKHDFCGVLTILRRVEWRLGQQEVVVLRLTAQVLEYAMSPKALHVAPIFNLPMLDWVSEGVGLRHGCSLVSDEKVKVLNAFLLCRSLATNIHSCRLLDTILRGDSAGNDVLRLTVACIPHLGVPSSIVNDNRWKPCSAHCGGSNVALPKHLLNSTHTHTHAHK